MEQALRELRPVTSPGMGSCHLRWHVSTSPSWSRWLEATHEAFLVGAGQQAWALKPPGLSAGFVAAGGLRDGGSSSVRGSRAAGQPERWGPDLRAGVCLRHELFNQQCTSAHGSPQAGAGVWLLGPGLPASWKAQPRVLGVGQASICFRTTSRAPSSLQTLSVVGQDMHPPCLVGAVPSHVQGCAQVPPCVQGHAGTFGVQGPAPQCLGITGLSLQSPASFMPK